MSCWKSFIVCARQRIFSWVFCVIKDFIKRTKASLSNKWKPLRSGRLIHWVWLIINYNVVIIESMHCSSFRRRADKFGELTNLILFTGSTTMMKRSCISNSSQGIALSRDHLPWYVELWRRNFHLLVMQIKSVRLTYTSKFKLIFENWSDVFAMVSADMWN